MREKRDRQQHKQKQKERAGGKAQEDRGWKEKETGIEKEEPREGQRWQNKNQ